VTYLLDANVVSYFLQVRRESDLAAAASVAPCAIVDEVRRELANDPVRGARFREWLPTSNVRVIPIAVGSDADAVLNRLQLAVTTTRGKGERASIALAATNDDLIFTGMDKGAMWIALRELWSPGERLVALAGFLRRLVDAHAMIGEAAEDVLRQSKQLVPTWWPGWRAAS
jgi:hypothetical protein